MPKHALKTTTIQLPAPTLKALREIAKKEGRSTSAQVRIFLAAAVKRINTEVAP